MSDPRTPGTATDERPVVLVGEAHPAVERAAGDHPLVWYAPAGSRPGLRRLRAGGADAAAVLGAAPGAPDGGAVATRYVEWGLAVPPGDPRGVTGVADLVDRDLTLANRPTDAGLRTLLATVVADLADARDRRRHDLIRSIRGFDAAGPGRTRAVRAVLSGGADAAPATRVTATALGAGFVPVDDTLLRVLADPGASGPDADPPLAALRRALDRAGFDVVDGAAAEPGPEPGG